MLSLSANAVAKVWWKSNVLTTAVINLCMEDVACEGKYFCLEKLSDGTLKLKRDHRYYYQCQMQIFSTRQTFCDFFWSSNELHVERLTLD